MNMSRKTTNEYIGVKRRAYADAKLEKRIRILNEVCETTGYSRKHANRLLTGSRKFHELVEKIKRKDGKGYTCKYDKSQTPYAKSLQFQKCYKVSKKHSSDANPGSTAVNPTIKH